MPNNKAFINFLLLLLVLFFGYTSCDTQESKQAEQDAPTIVKTPYKFEDERVKVADSLYASRKYAESIPEFELALNSFRDEEHWEGVLYSVNQLAISHRRIGNQKEAKEYFEEAKKTVADQFGGEHILLAQAYYYETVRYYQQNLFNDASRFVDTAFWHINKVDTYDSLLLKNITRYKYYAYYNSGQSLDTCIKYLDKRDAIYKNNRIASASDISFLMDDYVDYYRRINDFEKAQIYAQQKFFHLDSSTNTNKRDLLYALYSLATTHFDKAEYEKSLALSDQMIAMANIVLNQDEVAWVDFYNFRAASLAGLEYYKRALIPYEKARKILEDRGMKGDGYWQNLQNTAFSFSEIGRVEEAEKLFKASLRGMQDIYGKLNSRTADRHYFLGNFYLAQKRFEEAIEQYDSTLNSNSMVIERSRQLQVPRFTSKVSRRTLVALQKKAETLTIMGQDRQNEEYLNAALRHVDFTDSILTVNRREYEFTEGRLFLADYFKELYEIGLDATYALSGKNPNRKYGERIANYMFKSKNRLFLDQAGDYALVTNAAISTSLRDEYLRNLRRLESLEEELIDLLNSDFTNQRIQLLNIEKMEVNQRASDLREQILIKAGSDQILNQIEIYGNILKSLSKSSKKGYLEYFVGRNAIYSIGLDGENSVFNKIEIDENHYSVTNKLLRVLIDRPTIDRNTEDVKVYGQAAYTVYQQLLERLLSELNEDLTELIIVPDEHLSQIPFEALVTGFNGKERRFDQLDYIINQFETTYLLSSALLEGGKKKIKSKKRMLGFGFSGENLGNERSEYAELPGTTEEIRFLEKNIPGDYFLGPEATKQEFQKLAGSYSILHLAVHGEADKNNRLKSRLVFNGADDNVLKGNDLYSLNLKANLVVLSACESGVGELNQGEGTFSIARSFALAGISNLIMSLWKVDDKVASELMVGFHSNLMDSNITISKALHQSKKDYLMETDEYGAHPYYWATFVSLDGQSNVPQSHGINRLKQMALLLLALVVTMTLVYKKVIKKRRKT